MPVIQLQNAGQHFTKMGPKVEQAARRGLLAAAHRGVQTLIARIIPSRSPQPVDRGVYRAGWRAQAEDYGASISNTEPHAVFIEEGVRGSNVKGGRLMFDALYSWALRKGLGQTRVVATMTKVRFNKRTGKFTPTSTKVKIVPNDQKATSAFVWAVINSMKRRGIFNRPGPGLGIARELAENYLPEYAAEEVRREVQKVLEGG